MAKIKNPILFSTLNRVDPAAFDRSGLVDPFVNVDLQLFIDPVLLERSSSSVISNEGVAAFRRHFSNFIRLIDLSAQEGDAPWRAAARLLDLSEPPENGLGYGGSGRSGSSRPLDVRDIILRTAKEIVSLGARDPDMISLMGFFEDGVGPDTISDFTTHVIAKQLSQITEEFCLENGIPVFEREAGDQHRLPRIDDGGGNHRYMLLVPKDIVRDLPVANDWGEIEAAVAQSSRIRNAVNVLLGNIAKPTVSDRKRALRRFALQSPESLKELLDAVKEHVRTYDPNLDTFAYYKMRSIFASGFEGITSESEYDVHKGVGEIVRLVHDTLKLFKKHVEHGNLWEELWLQDKPKKERAAQLIYFAIADAYCRANNVDISPEANMGGGPIDFKFSHGYEARVLVEMKRSSGAVRHGYEKQLEIYLDASETEFGIYVIMNYGDLQGKFNQIQKIRSERLASGQRASDIIVIDATRKLSASKR